MVPRLRVGARWGARLGLYLGLLAAFVAVNPRRGRGTPEPPLPSFIAVFLGSLAGGIIVALGRRMVRDKYGAALLGAAAAAPFLLALTVALVGRRVLSAGGVLGIAAASLVVGGLLGVSQWSPRGRADAT